MMIKRTPVIRDCFKTPSESHGLDKVLTPEETIKRFQKRLEESGLKILKEVKRIDNGRLGIPVYFSICDQDALKIIGTKKQMGKGATEAQAKASACMELAERFSIFSFRNDDQYFLEANFSKIKTSGYPHISIEAFLKSVNDDSTSIEKAEKILNLITLKWCWAKDLVTQKDILVPFDWFFLINQYNGSSAGNSIEEAAVQAICEVIERDVCYKIATNHLKTPTINIESIKNPVAKELIKKFLANDINLILKDFSLNTGVPTVGVLAWDPSTFPIKSEIVYTAGTTTEPEKSVIRALTEVAQLAGDFNSASSYEPSGLPKPQNLEEVSYIIKDQSVIDIEKLPNVSSNNLAKEINSLVNTLKDRCNYDTFLIDITHPVLNIPSVYAIIAGAEFRERASTKNIALFAAKLLSEKGDIKSIIELSKIVRDAYFIYFFLAKDNYERGQLKEACDYFKKALDVCNSTEDIPYILSYFGLCLKDMKDYDNAIKVLKDALKYDPNRPDIYNIIGTCLFYQKRHKEAIEMFLKAVDLNPSSAVDWANIGINYLELGETEPAIEFLKIALTIDPDLDFAKKRLNFALKKQNAY